MADLISTTDIQRIAEEGAKIYEGDRKEFESKHTGEFLAIDVDSKKSYLGATSAEVLEKAKEENPEKVFYVVKIGFDNAETIANFYIRNRG